MNENRLFSRLSLNHRIWMGVGVLLALFAGTSLNSMFQFSGIRESIGEAIGDIQPMMMASQTLAIDVETANSSLGLFLLTKEASYREAYANSLSRGESVLSRLQAMPAVATNPVFSGLVADIRQDFVSLASYQEKFIRLGTDDSANLPGLRIAEDKLNPIARELLQVTSQMIDSENMEENGAGTRTRLRASVQSMYSMVNKIMSELRTYIAFRGDPLVKNMQTYREIFDEQLAVFREASDLWTFEEEEAAELLVNRWEEYTLALDEMIDIHGSDRYRMDAWLIRTEVAPILERLQQNLGRLTASGRQLTENTGSVLQAGAQAASIWIKVLLVVVIGLGFVIAYGISRMVIGPINRTARAMEALAQGDGDLTQRLEVNGQREVSALARSFNAFAERVQNLVGEVSSTVDDLTSCSDAMGDISLRTQDGVNRQRTQTEMVASAVTQMVATIQEVAANAGKAAEAAAQADRNAETGKQEVTTNMAAIQALASEIDDVTRAIEELSHNADAIGGVLDVIQGIAEQTNLLALNAAIEAARAGEQGRGFAVVADEVRTLAGRTQDSTGEIQSIIGALQHKVANAASVIQASRDRARESVEQATRAGDALNSITNSVATISDMNSQIATAANEQSAVAEEINKNIVNISHASEANAAASDKLTSTADELNRLSNRLGGLVNDYRH